MAKFGIESSLLLPVILLLAAIFGYYVPHNANRILTNDPVVCQNDKLFKQPLKSTSCPLDPQSDTKVLYANSDAYGEDREIIVSLIAKRNPRVYTEKNQIRISLDAALLTIDKKTNNVVHREYSNLSDEHHGIFKGNISVKLPILASKMHPDHYYMFEIYEVRAYNLIEIVPYSIDQYPTKRIMINVLVSTTQTTAFSTLRSYQSYSLILLAIVCAAFLAHLTRQAYHRPRIMVEPYTILAISYTACAMLYVMPSNINILDILELSITAKLAMYIMATSCTLDCLIFIRCLPRPINSLLPFIMFVFNYIMSGFLVLGARETASKRFPVYFEDRLQNAVLYQNHVRGMMAIKFKIYVICAAVGYLRYQSVRNRVRQLLPSLIIVAYWLTGIGGTKLSYMEDEKNPHKVYYETAFVPVITLVLQYCALLPDTSYLLMPSVTESPKIVTNLQN